MIKHIAIEIDEKAGEVRVSTEDRVAHSKVLEGDVFSKEAGIALCFEKLGISTAIMSKYATKEVKELKNKNYTKVTQEIACDSIKATPKTAAQRKKKFVCRDVFTTAITNLGSPRVCMTQAEKTKNFIEENLKELSMLYTLRPQEYWNYSFKDFVDFLLSANQ